MKQLEGLKISRCQMNVTPGRPDINAKYIIGEIRSASERGVDMIIFPELCTSGYLIADEFEDTCFIKDVEYWNNKITESVPANLIAIFGTVISSSPSIGEDGRQRFHNGAILAQHSRRIACIVKTLQPHYRYFDDDKHFFSFRKIAEELAELFRQTDGRGRIENCSVHDLLKVHRVQTSIGIINLGVLICEDIWDNDYALKPAQILAEKGADIIIAISASPWGWQKNRKRHQVVKALIQKTGVPIIYVNNTGGQNNNDNVVVFDGASTDYDHEGNIIHEFEPYFEGTQDIVLSSNLKPLPERPEDDSKELYLATKHAIEYMLSMLPEKNQQVVIGLSGGIDSAVVAALMVNTLGPERVKLINMPYEYSDPSIKELAYMIAKNLGSSLEICPIKEIVDAIAEHSGVIFGEFAHQNIQARARMEILAAKAQKLGGVFTCNANKVEITFGYGTLDGDMRGWFIPLGDFKKREVRQLANYLNREVFEKEVIPRKCIDQKPSAELDKDQKDPFDYGYPNKHGYHDEWVGAVTEHGWNPETFVEKYISGNLEKELKLEPGTLKHLFPTDKDFIQDLERCWGLYKGSVFKRGQAPLILVISRRAFGRDKEESILSIHYTQRYLSLKESICKS